MEIENKDAHERGIKYFPTLPVTTVVTV